MSTIGIDSMIKKKKEKDRDQMKEDIINLIIEEIDQIKKKEIMKQKVRKYLMKQIIKIDQKNMKAIEIMIKKMQENIDKSQETDILSDNNLLIYTCILICI